MNKRTRTFVAAGLVGGVCVVVAVSSHLLRPSERPFWAMVSALEADAQPTTWNDFVSAAADPDENGADLLGDAWAWLDRHAPPMDAWTYTGPWNPSVFHPWEETSTEEQVTELREFVAGLSPFYDLVNAALERPRMQWDSPEFNVLAFPNSGHVKGIQRTGQLLHVRSVVGTSERQRVDAIRGELALGQRWIAGTALQHLVANAIVAGAARDLRRALEQRAIDATEARTRLDEWLQPRSLRRVRDVINEERVRMIASYRSILEGATQPHRPLPHERVKYWLGNAPEPPEFHAGMAEQVVRFCDQRTRALRLPMRTFRSAKTELDVTLAWSPDETPFISYVGLCVERFARTEAACRLGRIALAVGVHHDTNGTWPDSLDELRTLFPDGVPVDPYTDGPFLFVRTDKGVRIASAGPNGDPVWQKSYTPEDMRQWGLVWEFER